MKAIRFHVGLALVGAAELTMLSGWLICDSAITVAGWLERAAEWVVGLDKPDVPSGAGEENQESS